MPSRTIFCGGSPTRSRPSNDTLPLSGRRWPVIRLKKVVLPAPLGPMMAWFSPVRSSKETSRVATKPANDFHRPPMLSMVVMIGLRVPSRVSPGR